MKKKLSTFEASSIICGYGIGSGVLAMPKIVTELGFPLACVIILLAYAASLCLHLMIAHLCIKKGESGGLVETISNCLSESKAKKALTIILFIVLAIILYSNLAVYICCASDILCSLFGGYNWIYKIAFYLVAALIGISGLKILGISEKYAVFFTILLEIALFIGSLFNINGFLPTDIANAAVPFSFFSVAMFGFVAFFSIPQVVTGLEKDAKKVTKSIVIGMSVNMVLMIAYIVSALLASPEVTEVSIIGLSNGIGLWAKIVGSIFTILILLTSYWAIAVSLKDMVVQTLKINKVLSYIIASVPSILIALIPSATFIRFLNLTSSGMAILVIFFLLPLFHINRSGSDSIFKKLPVIPIEVIVLISSILMVVGSFL